VKSFAGVLQLDGSPPDRRLLHHFATTISLAGSSPPVFEIDSRCGMVVVSHGREATGAPTADSARKQRTPTTSFNAFSEQSLLSCYGEFSFAMWNIDRRELICARDRFGVRPFFYCRTPRELIFSDSLEAVIAHPAVRFEELEDGVVADFLESGVTLDAAATIYAQVRRLPPAHVLRCSDDGAMVIERYWTLPTRGPTRGPGRRPVRLENSVEHLEAALKDSIADRVEGSSALVFMSGGIDSTLLASLTRDVRPETKLLAETSVYRSRIADVEEEFAKEAARSIGIPIRIFPLDAYDPLQALDEDIWTVEPGPMLSAAMTRDIYRTAALHAPVAIDGHPADAVMSIDLIAYLRALPIRQRYSELLRYTFLRRRPPYFFFRPRGVVSRAVPPDWQRVRREPAAAVEEHPLDSPIWSNYFEWAHPLMTRAAVELVYPWCDARVIEAAMELEAIPWLVDKHVAREMLRGRVSERIRLRKKSYLAEDPWKAALSDCDLEIAAAARFIDRNNFRSACAGEGFYSDSLLRALVFESWLRKLPNAVRRFSPLTV